ncbi:hypothetical protein G7078_01750 [Sphingomonas sinipercae]|uniref:Uncharacterized protein n=1 Tax=Sphingomonas sinipercae TaxID=2714944 RepID=A0A6G7ZL41_9SPHN|nr:hypothetical protein [Sphingomonas sinipercae]QIL01638.1 hypothetical protein G7078_01750 [Sphingomonas sinipercae]
MSAPLRFLTLAIAGWAAVRMTALGAIPGFTITPARAALPPIVPTQLASFEPQLAPPTPWPNEPVAAAAPGQYFPQFRPMAIPVPYYMPVSAPAAQVASALPALAPRGPWSLPALDPSSIYYPAAAEGFSPLPPLNAIAQPAAQSVPAAVQSQQPGGKLDRWQMSSWAVLRGPSSPGTLAAGGTLGGSQGGARVTYAFNKWLAASLRTTSPLGGSRGAEIAGGVRFTPMQSVPVAFTLERRQSISSFGGGRSDFALFAESGLYNRPVPLGFLLDGYMQAGMVGIGKRDLFADGALAFTRPVYGRYSAGFGMWGGYQTGIYRVDAGPRVTVRLRNNIRAHVDYRQRLAGSALPNSGAALTLAADF